MTCRMASCDYWYNIVTPFYSAVLEGSDWCWNWELQNTKVHAVVCMCGLKSCIPHPPSMSTPAHAPSHAPLACPLTCPLTCLLTFPCMPPCMPPHLHLQSCTYILTFQPSCTEHLQCHPPTSIDTLYSGKNWWACIKFGDFGQNAVLFNMAKF